LTKYQTELLSIGDSVNLICFWHAVFDCALNRTRLLDAYTDAFIRMTQAKVVITFIDNAADFYTISTRLPNVKTILLQNGTRDNWLERLKPNVLRHVDYMFVHGAAIGRFYQKYISGNILVTGSLKNNNIPVQRRVVKDTVLYISQFHAIHDSNDFFWITRDGRSISAKEFFSIEPLLMEWIADWCALNKKRLLIAGRDSEMQGEEKAFYSKYLKDTESEYFPRSSGYSSYELVDKAEMLVSLDSTLGYESLCRNTKLAFLSCRSEKLATDTKKFGWPAVLPDDGFFWTNRANEQEIRRVLDQVNILSDEQWESARQEFIPEIMALDSNNTQLVALLDSLLLKSLP
jgi:surface carbohydrate biosynthesis protein